MILRSVRTMHRARDGIPSQTHEEHEICPDTRNHRPPKGGKWRRGTNNIPQHNSSLSRKSTQKILFTLRCNPLTSSLAAFDPVSGQPRQRAIALNDAGG